MIQRLYVILMYNYVFNGCRGRRFKEQAIAPIEQDKKTNDQQRYAEGSLENAVSAYAQPDESRGQDNNIQEYDSDDKP
ncbi:hypothetical protein GCM10008933_16840 [Paenibacillus motobuensis]|uniref:DUF4025 domain-containing protein n=1 Tax=Paenibacillus motobuensis TaxID=295324 RepID=A0ABN0Y8F0_9BACL